MCWYVDVGKGRCIKCIPTMKNFDQENRSHLYTNPPQHINTLTLQHKKNPTLSPMTPSYRYGHCPSIYPVIVNRCTGFFGSLEYTVTAFCWIPVLPSVIRETFSFPSSPDFILNGSTNAVIQEQLPWTDFICNSFVPVFLM